MKKHKLHAYELIIGALVQTESCQLVLLNAIDIQKIVNGEAAYYPVEINEEILNQLGFEGNEDQLDIAIPTGDGVDLSIEYSMGTTCLVRKHTGKEKLKPTSDFDYCYIRNPHFIHQVQLMYLALSGQNLDVSKLIR